MRAIIKTLFILAVPTTITLCDSAAIAKKHRHHSKDAEETKTETPTPVPAAAPAAAPASASVSASVSVSATTEQPTAAVSATVSTPPADPTPPAVVTPPPAPPPEQPPPAPPPPPPRKDGVRFRGGVAIVGGGEFISGFTAGLVGVDGRLGVQINKLIGIYIQPHVSFGAGTISGISGATGSAAATAMIDFTFIDRIFVGAGGGYGIVNNPNGPVVQLRLGGYPVMAHSQVMPRRKGLMIGFDGRAYFTPLGPVLQTLLAVGYEAY